MKSLDDDAGQLDRDAGGFGNLFIPDGFAENGAHNQVSSSYPAGAEALGPHAGDQVLDVVTAHRREPLATDGGEHVSAEDAPVGGDDVVGTEVLV